MNQSSSLSNRKPRSVGREYLKKQLRKQGHSRPLSVEILDAIFEAMSAALVRGEDVETPFGKLKLVPHHHRTQEGKFLGKKRTIYRRRYTVVHEMDENGNSLLNPPPPKPKPRVVLPPKPWEKPEEKKINLRLTMRRAKKTVPPSKTVEPPAARRPGQLVLPPKPGSPAGTAPKLMTLNPNLRLRRPLVLPPKPWEKKAGK